MACAWGVRTCRSSCVVACAWGVRTCSVLRCGACLRCKKDRFSGSAVEPEARAVAGERCAQCFQAPGKHKELERKKDTSGFGLYFGMIFVIRVCDKGVPIYNHPWPAIVW